MASYRLRSTHIIHLRQTVTLLVVIGIVSAMPGITQARPLITYLTGDTPADGQVVFRVVFNSAVADSAKLTIVASESDTDLRLDNIDFVPGSGFSEVIVTAQSTSTANGALTSYNVLTGAELPDVIGSTNAVADAPAGPASRPASIVPNPSGTHYYYTENQFGFAGTEHRMMRVPIAGGVEEEVYDGVGDSLVEFSGVEIVGDRMFFFAHDAGGPAAERQLYSVELGAGTGLAVGGTLAVEVTGLDRSSGLAGPGFGVSDGSDEMDFDPSTGLLFGTNISTGETIGFDIADAGLGVGPVPVGGLPFLIDAAVVTASAGFSTDVGLGLLSGLVTPGAAGPVREIDGIRPDGEGRLVVIGHDGVIVGIDIGGVLGDGADDGDIIRYFNRDVPTAGMTIGFSRTGLRFDDHTILAPIPEPSTVMLAVVGACGFLIGCRRFRNR